VVSPTTATFVMHLNPKMTDFNYKKYSLEQLENWMHDAMSAGEASPQEIYDTIRKVVEENYYHHKHHVSQAYELLTLLHRNNGQSYEDVIREREYYESSMPPWGHSDLEYGVHHKEPLSCDKDDPSPECKKSWTNFQEDATYPLYVSEDGDMWIPDYVVKKENKVVKWQLPVQQSEEDYFVEFPDDLLEAANLKEGDQVEWVDNHNGTYTLRKVDKA
jgi:hypothetical protein